MVAMMVLEIEDGDDDDDILTSQSDATNMCEKHNR